MGNLKGI